MLCLSKHYINSETLVIKKLFNPFRVLNSERVKNSETLALMEAASFAAGVRQQRYSVQQEIAPDYQADYSRTRIVPLKICSFNF
jgi:hypothetical protein